MSRRVTRQGIVDLTNNLPYTLCFVNEINSVDLIPTAITYRLISEKVVDKSLHLKMMTVEIAKKGEEVQELKFVLLSKGLTSIAIPVKTNGESTTIIPIGIDVPKIFCDFPLIGTEAFPFPTIINNPNFNPTDPRDGIFLTDSTRANRLTDENKQILEDAVTLYFDLLDYAIKNNWENLHLLAKLGNLREPILSNTSITWYERAIQDPIRKKLESSSIVKNA